MTARASSQTQAPISSHPLFPAIVALWFAALMGLGTLVLPGVLFDKLAIASGLADALPLAQPPLGMTARLLVALAAGGAGTLLGLSIARKVADSQAETAPRRARAPSPEAGAVKRPISVREELDEEYVAGDDAAEFETGPGPVFDELAADVEARTLDDSDQSDEPTDDATPARDPLDLAQFAMTVADTQAEPPAGAWAPEAPVTSDSPAPVDVDDYDHPALARPSGPFAHEWDADVADWAGDNDDEALDSPIEAFEPQVFDAPEPAPEPAPAPDVAPAVADRPLDELGIVELVERFALALQRRTAPEPSVDAAAPVEEERADDESEADIEADTGGYSSLLAIKPLGNPREFVGVGDRAEPVVVFPRDQQPRCASPASDGPSRGPLTDASSAPAAARGETERALRTALEKLQKMSGVA